MSVKLPQSQQHVISKNDELLIAAIENNHMQLAEFNHVVHVKLAYCYLATLGYKLSLKKMQNTLTQFLKYNGVSNKKFHVTMTQGWLMAIWHFMQKNLQMNSADEFIKANPVLLNKDLLLSHYSHDLLFSDRARKRFIHPDLNAFPNF